MTLDQLRQFHELRQEHKRDRKLIEEQQAKLAELTKYVQSGSFGLCLCLLGILMRELILSRAAWKYC
jgi:hypothetical protein